MQFHALATDYDGTLARDGKVDSRALEALKSLKVTGRKLLLVTGRELNDLLSTFFHPEVFDLIVAENGALLYNPATKQERVICEPPPTEFITRLREHNLPHLSSGKVIVATWEPHQVEVLAAIKELNLDLQVIFNKGAVMVLPAGVNKATGLTAALQELKISTHNVIAVGDAENDIAFFKACECSVAVANALESVKKIADIVTVGEDTNGVIETCNSLLAGEARFLEACARRHQIEIGSDHEGKPVFISPHKGNVLIAGSTGGGKSTLAMTIIEALSEKKYQFCLVDPEGDFAELEIGTVLGTGSRAPVIEELSQVLSKPSESLIVNFIGVPFKDRPEEFSKLMYRVSEQRNKSGHPHCLVIDEAHHVLPEEAGEPEIPHGRIPSIFITLSPLDVPRSAVEPVSQVIGVGKKGSYVLEDWARISGRASPNIPEGELIPGTVLLWNCLKDEHAILLRVKSSGIKRRRHKRKYIEGELSPERSFYFRGSAGKFNLRAANLIEFMQIGGGLDEELWKFHFLNGDYFEWLEKRIKDPELAESARRLDSTENWEKLRAQLNALINERYTIGSRSFNEGKTEKT